MTTEPTREQLQAELEATKRLVQALQACEFALPWNDNVALRTVVEATAAHTGRDFFQVLVKHLAEALDVNWAMVAEFAGNRGRMRSLALWAVDQLHDNTEFDLTGTPCARVVRGEYCHYSGDLARQFPGDTGLAEMHAQCYLGVPMVSSAGEVLGHLAVMDNKPDIDATRGLSVMRVFASRAAAELERLYALEALRRGEERFRGIFEHSYDAIFLFDTADDRILDANPRAWRMLGFDNREELLSRRISDIHPDEMRQLQSFTESVIARGHGWTNELTCLTKSGQTLEAEISASLVPDDEGACVIALVRDITERKRTQDALKESRERLSRILASAMDAIVTIEDDRRIRLFNDAAEKVFRCSQAQAVAQPVDRFLSEGFQQLLQRYMAQAAQGGERATQWLPDGLTAVRADGETFPTEATLSWVQVAGRNLYTLILRDVNDRRRAEAEVRRLNTENLFLQAALRTQDNQEGIVGVSSAVRDTLEKVELVAATDSTVLILGETGTGKELFARAIHGRGPRGERPLIQLNCAALPAGLVESELFGHEKGAFTGAVGVKLGRFELADNGTLFLDEIGELPEAAQAKLLRVLQEGEFERVGGTKTRRSNVRLIAATNRDLARMVSQGLFREDLFYRLNVFPITLPPLRQRPEDIPLLVEHFVARFAKKLGRRIRPVSPDVMERIKAYAWPGNVRELENMVERAIILARDDVPAFDAALLPPASGAPAPAASDAPFDPRPLQDVERDHIRAVLEQTGWVIDGPKGAARILDLHPNTLRSRLKKLDIQRPTHDIS